jgi:hypothetical protein
VAAAAAAAAGHGGVVIKEEPGVPPGADGHGGEHAASNE